MALRYITQKIMSKSEIHDGGQSEIINETQAKMPDIEKSVSFEVVESTSLAVNDTIDHKSKIRVGKQIPGTDYIVKEVGEIYTIGEKDFYRTKIEDTKTTYVFLSEKLELARTTDGDIIKRIGEKFEFSGKKLIEVSLMNSPPVLINEDFKVLKTGNGDIIKYVKRICVIGEKMFFNTQLDNKERVVVNEDFDIAKTSDGKIMREVRKEYILGGKKIYNVRIDKGKNKEEDIFIDENFKIIKTSEGMIPREIRENHVMGIRVIYDVIVGKNKDCIIMDEFFERIKTSDGDFIRSIFTIGEEKKLFEARLDNSKDVIVDENFVVVKR